MAIKNFHGLLNKGGCYILIESFVESWENLNNARKEMVLDTIPQSPQNRYIDEDLIKTMIEMGFLVFRSGDQIVVYRHSCMQKLNL